MAWFGEGFSSLKGQISNFTKEIVSNNIGPLSSESEDLPEGGTDLKVKKKIEELEQSCKNKEIEITILREENSRLVKKLEETGAALHPTKEATFEQGNADFSTSSLPLINWEEECTPDTFLGQETAAVQKPPKDVKLEEEISSLRSKLRQTFQDKVLMEQSCSRLEKEVHILTEQLTKKHKSVNRSSACQATQTQIPENLQQTAAASATPDVIHLQQENEQLFHERAQLRTELAAMARVVQDLESQVAVSQDENANLSTGLEELDIQHQEAIEQIMNLKESTQKRYEVLTEEYEELKQKYEEIVDKNKSAGVKSVETQTDESDSIVAIKNEQDTEAMEECKKKACKCEFYEDFVNTMAVSIPREYYPEQSTDDNDALSRLTGLKNAYLHVHKKYISIDNEVRELKHELNHRDDELQNLESENATLRSKIDDLVRQCESLPPILENSEELEAMETRINSLENEIAVLREVRSNLEAELLQSRNERESVIRRLQATEATVKNQDNLQTEISKYKIKEKDLIEKLQNYVDEKQHMENEAIKLCEALDNEKQLHIEFDNEREKLKQFYEQKEEKLIKDLTAYKDCDELNRKISEQLENERSLREQLEEEMEMLRNQDIEKNTLISKYKNLEIELTEKLNSYNYEKEELEKHILNLNNELDIKKKVILEWEQDRIKTGEISTVNEQLHRELAEYQDNVKKIAEELESERTVRKQLKEEKIQMSAEFQHLHGLAVSKSDEIENLIIKQKETDGQLVREQLLKTQLENEKTHLLNENSRFEDVERKLQNVLEELELEKSDRCQLMDEKELLFSELEKFTEKQKQIEEKLGNEEKLRKQLEQEIARLQDENSRLEDVKSKKTLKITEELQMQQSASAQIIGGKESSEVVKSKESGKIHKEMLKQSSNDTLSELKYLGVAQKCRDLESQVLDLMERVDTMKAESTVKDRKLCEILLEKSVLEKELETLKNSESELKRKYTDHLNNMESKTEINVDSINFNEELSQLRRERDELIQSLQAKHMENVEYHGEIQRLNGLLSSELSKTEMFSTKCSTLVRNLVELQQRLEEKDALLLSHQASSDRQVSFLKQQVETLQNQLEYASQLLRDVDRQEAEGQPASDSPSGKTSSNKEFNIGASAEEERNSLYENLQQEQLRNKYLQNEVQEQHEKESNLVKELERLRSHLMSVEENYTQEMVRAEQQVKELQLRLGQADERVKTSSTAYTSASIRANQQVESLSKQIRMLTEQKDKLTAQVATAEDKLYKQAAALTNLQIVLEQFQRDKEKDVEVETERIKQILQVEKNRNCELGNEIKSLQVQLKEAKEGLNAAARLGEQLDKKTQTIQELKQEVVELTERLHKAEERVQAASVSVEGKVDRCLVRNLVVGYLCAPASSRLQALTVIATVLDFSQDDRQRIGLEANNKADANKQQSLSEAFIRFLENESRPQPQLRLPLTDTDKDSRSRKTSMSEVGLPAMRRTSGSILKDVLKQDGSL